MARMITQDIDSPKNKKVLLFSGGMDSLILSKLFEVDILLYFIHENRYQELELESIRRLIGIGAIAEERIRYCSIFNFQSLERDDAIIPGRNLYFILAAANYGETIYLGSVDGDRTLDKSVDFFERCETMMNYLYQDQHWCKGREFRIYSPIKSFTKTELVREYLKQGFDPHALYMSMSCYNSNTKPCGWCKPCFRKWVSFILNDLPASGYFSNDPKKADYIDDIISQIRNGIYRSEKEDKEIMAALSNQDSK